MEDPRIQSLEGGLSLFEAAKKLRSQYPINKDLVIAVGKYIVDHARTVPNPLIPQSIIESRFMSAEDAFAGGTLSCGAMANISAAMLRHVGLDVMLVHGEYEGSVDHAWISVFDPQLQEWVEYDLTEEDGLVKSDYIRKAVVHSWEEIRDQIEDDHRTLRERKEARKGV
jgi:transglutaminase-like putative cysteine protease